MWRVRKGWWGRPDRPCTRTPALHPQSQTAQSRCRSWLRRPGTQLQPPRQMAGPSGPEAGERRERRSRGAPPDHHTQAVPTPHGSGPLLPGPARPPALWPQGRVLRPPAPPIAGSRCFLGRYFGKGEGIREVCPEPAPGAHSQPPLTVTAGGSGPPWSCSPVDPDTILTLIQGQSFGHGCYCPLQRGREEAQSGKMRLPALCSRPGAVLQGPPRAPTHSLEASGTHRLCFSGDAGHRTCLRWFCVRAEACGGPGREGKGRVPWWPHRELPATGQSPQLGWRC